MPFLTIFTPTYNRGYILSNLFESLQCQKCKDFEWIIVDDDSSDDTEELIRKFEPKGFSIKYYRQKHGGKHRAINLGVKNAAGTWFFIVDSDDCLTDDATELIWEWTRDISDNMICGVAGLKISTTGKTWGGNPNFQLDTFVEAGNLERKKYNLDGDKAEVYRTDILKKYPFPEFDNEYFVTEGVVWNAIAADGYKLRWHNRPIYVCEYLEDGLTKGGANAHKGHIANMHGYAVYVKQIMEWCPWREGLAEFIEFNFCCVEKCMPFRLRAICLNISFFSYIIWWLGTLCFRAYDKIIRIANERI